MSESQSYKPSHGGYPTAPTPTPPPTATTIAEVGGHPDGTVVINGAVYPSDAPAGRAQCNAYEGGWLCTRPNGHAGQHAAYGLDARRPPYHVWDDNTTHDLPADTSTNVDELLELLRPYHGGDFRNV